MDTSDLIMAAVGLVVSVLAGVVGRASSAGARNGREVSELRGRLAAVEHAQADLGADVSNAHRRIGGVGRTADQSAGELRLIRPLVTQIQEWLLLRGGEQK